MSLEERRLLWLGSGLGVEGGELVLGNRDVGMLTISESTVF